MRKKIIYLLLLIVSLASCLHSRETKYIVLPYHTDSTKKSFNYLVVNHPADSLQLLIELVTFYKSNSLNFYKDITDEETLSYTIFYEKNRKTSYFLKHPDDPGGFSSEILYDYYFYGGYGYPQSGLVAISAERCINDSTKWIFEIYHCIDRKNDKWRHDTFRNECLPGWLEQQKDNKLVGLFNPKP